MNLPNLLSLFRLFVTAFFILLVAYERYQPCPHPLRNAGRQRPPGRLLRQAHGHEDEPGRLPRPRGRQGNARLVVHRALRSGYIAVLAGGRRCFLRDLVISLGFLILWKKGPVSAAPCRASSARLTTVFQMLTIVYVLAFADRSFALFFFYHNRPFDRAYRAYSTFL